MMRALQEAGTTVCEPVHRFHLEIPSDTFGAVSRHSLGWRGRSPRSRRTRVSSQLEGDIAAARVHELQQRMPALTRGEGVLTTAFDHYRPIRGEPPSRPGRIRIRSTAGSTCGRILPRF
jgi:ribosomal protection tetracycline resistance protein